MYELQRYIGNVYSVRYSKQKINAICFNVFNGQLLCAYITSATPKNSFNDEDFIFLNGHEKLGPNRLRITKSYFAIASNRIDYFIYKEDKQIIDRINTCFIALTPIRDLNKQYEDLHKTLNFTRDRELIKDYRVKLNALAFEINDRTQLEIINNNLEPKSAFRVAPDKEGIKVIYNLYQPSRNRRIYK